MAIPNLLDPRMLSQVGLAPPLQDTTTSLPIRPFPTLTPPASALTPPPNVPTGMGTDVIARPTPPPPTFTQTLVKSIPLLLAGIAASRGGPGGAGALLSGYAEALQKQRLLEEKQHEFDVQQAATEEERQQRIADRQAATRARIGTYVTGVREALDKLDDPALYAAALKSFDETGQAVHGLPAGYVTQLFASGFDKSKAATKAQKDAAARIKEFRDYYGDAVFNRMVEQGATVQDKTGVNVPLRSLMALAQMPMDAEGKPVPLTSTPKNQFDLEQQQIDEAVQQFQKKNGRAATAEEVRKIGNDIRGEAAAATRGEPSSTEVTYLYKGVPTIGNRNPKTGVITPAVDPEGNIMHPVPSVAQATAAANAEPGPDITPFRPEPATANIRDPRTGLTPNMVFQSGIAWALTNQMPSMGMSNQGQVWRARTDIENKGSAVVAASGVDLPTLRAEYKAKAPALAKIKTFYTLTSAAAGSAKDSLALASDQSAKVPRGQTPIANTFKQWLVTGDKALDSDPELAKLQLYIYTAVREYAKVTGGGAGSVAALTDYASKQADRLLSAAQSPDTFASVSQAMQNDMDVVTANQLKQVEGISQEIASFFSAVTGVPIPEGKAPDQTPGAGGTGRQTAAGPAGVTPPPAAKTPTVTISGRTVTGPTGSTYTYPTEAAAQAAAAALKAAYGIK